MPRFFLPFLDPTLFLNSDSIKERPCPSCVYFTFFSSFRTHANPKFVHCFIKASRSCILPQCGSECTGLDLGFSSHLKLNFQFSFLFCEKQFRKLDEIVISICKASQFHCDVIRIHIANLDSRVQNQYVSQIWILKIVGNEKGGVSGSKLLLEYGFAPCRSMSVYFLMWSSSFLRSISVACL